MDRLNRFVRAYPAAVKQLQDTVAVADLRYPNGFAVKPAHTQIAVKGKE